MLDMLEAATICFRRSLGKLAPVIINSVLNSSDMMFRLAPLKLGWWMTLTKLFSLSALIFGSKI